MLANIWLKRHGSQPTIWPEEAVAGARVIGTESIAAVKAADAMDYEPPIALHRGSHVGVEFGRETRSATARFTSAQDCPRPIPSARRKSFRR